MEIFVRTHTGVIIKNSHMPFTIPYLALLPTIMRRKFVELQESVNFILYQCVGNCFTGVVRRCVQSNYIIECDVATTCW